MSKDRFLAANICEICGDKIKVKSSFRNTGVCCEACRKVRDGDKFEVIKSVN